MVPPTTGDGGDTMRTMMLGCLAGWVAAAGVASAAEPGIEAITRPSADLTLAFVRPGRIAEMPVKEGDAVKPGDLLVRLDDEAERLQCEELKAQADDLVRIQAAEAQWAQKKEDLKKLEWAGKEGAATEWEIAHARLEVTIGDLSVQLARFNQQQDRKKYEEAAVQLNRMRLASPIAGKVEQIFLKPGESAEALAKVIRVVKTDLLWIDVPVPLAPARALKVGGAAQVAYPGCEDKPVEGKIIFVAAVADAASETLTVRVEAPNPSSRPAGERVRVQFVRAEGMPGKPVAAATSAAP